MLVIDRRTNEQAGNRLADTAHIVKGVGVGPVEISFVDDFAILFNPHAGYLSIPPRRYGFREALCIFIRPFNALSARRSESPQHVADCSSRRNTNCRHHLPLSPDLAELDPAGITEMPKMHQLTSNQ